MRLNHAGLKPQYAITCEKLATQKGKDNETLDPLAHRWWLIAGRGLLALFNPLAASLTAEHLIGWLLLIAGALQLFSAFRTEQGWGRIWSGVLGALGIFVGVSLLARPLEGLVTLTFLVALFFIGSGAAKLVWAFGLRGASGFWLILISGTLSIALGVMVFANSLDAAITLLGTLLAIDLISSGAALIALALGMRRFA